MPAFGKQNAAEAWTAPADSRQLRYGHLGLTLLAIIMAAMLLSGASLNTRQV